MSNLTGVLLVLGLCLLMAAGLFFIFRALFLWYWKIDEILLTLQKIEGHLRGKSAPGPDRIGEG